MGRILIVENLCKVFQKNKQEYPAVNNISFFLDEGECLGIVGESGCGKTTIVSMITGFVKPDKGTIRLKGSNIEPWNPKTRKELYKSMQMVFQNPVESFNPRIRLGNAIMESMMNRGFKRSEARERMHDLLKECGLFKEHANRYPHQVSGGECQRAAIARALASQPDVLICDEITSALDVMTQEQIMGLIRKMKEQKGLSLLFICHDLAVIQQVCSRVLVIYQGRIIEEGTPDDIIRKPQQEYTKKLVASVYDIS